MGGGEAWRWKTGVRCDAGEYGLCPEVDAEGPVEDYAHENVIARFTLLKIKTYDILKLNILKIKRMTRIQVGDGGQRS